MMKYLKDYIIENLDDNVTDTSSSIVSVLQTVGVVFEVPAVGAVRDGDEWDRYEKIPMKVGIEDFMVVMKPVINKREINKIIHKDYVDSFPDSVEFLLNDTYDEDIDFIKKTDNVAIRYDDSGMYEICFIDAPDGDVFAKIKPRDGAADLENLENI